MEVFKLVGVAMAVVLAAVAFSRCDGVAATPADEDATCRIVDEATGVSRSADYTDFSHKAIDCIEPQDDDAIIAMLQDDETNHESYQQLIYYCHNLFIYNTCIGNVTRCARKCLQYPQKTEEFTEQTSAMEFMVYAACGGSIISKVLPNYRNEIPVPDPTDRHKFSFRCVLQSNLTLEEDLGGVTPHIILPNVNGVQAFKKYRECLYEYRSNK